MRSYDEYLQLTESNLIPELQSLGRVPSRILEPMKYSLSAGGKRVRPVMLLAACDMGCGKMDRAIPFACALEMIHTYSLIHDDLPAMDNDDERRGRPSCHVAYGEDIAILAGDGLLSAACEIMMREAVNHPDGRAAAAAYAVLRRAGITGMVGGQTVDVTMERQPVTEETVTYIHLHKTADLLTAPMEAGLILAGAAPEQMAAGITFGQKLGLAFQMMDDLLDVEGDPSLLGKRTGLDDAAGKQTWVALRGIHGTHEDLKRTTEEAVAALAIFEEKGNFFKELAMKMLRRVQ
ncbi:MAG: polyprenyl synthetase family protein [Clostridia bacterium]|nr:polyprenyl synthetase family protein [Clostridia bacterium]